VWSIRNLRAAQEADRGDEKAKDTLVRLTQFRTFYVLCIAWLYFTRIVVWLIQSSIAWDRQWLAPLIAELATAAFYGWTGFRFRPAPDNSDYLRVPVEEGGDAPPGATAAETAAATAAAAATAPGAAIDDDDEERGRSSAASVRVHAGPTQTKAKQAVDADAAEFAASAATAGGAEAAAAKAAAADAAADKAPAKSKAKPAAGKPAAATGVAIDDPLDEDEDFGLDHDDLQYPLGEAPTAPPAAAAAVPAPGRLKKLGGATRE